MPAGDLYVLDDEAQELLAFGEREFVDPGCGTLREGGHALAQPVVSCEFVALGDQSVSLLGERAVARVDVAGATLDVGKLEQPGLVEVRQAASLRSVGVELAVDPGELDG